MTGSLKYDPDVGCAETAAQGELSVFIQARLQSSRSSSVTANSPYDRHDLIDRTSIRDPV